MIEVARTGAFWRHAVGAVLDRPDGRPRIVFALASGAMALVLVVLAVLTDSLAVTAFAFLTSYHAALAIALMVGAVAARHQATADFSYGWTRLGVMGEFSVAVSLLFSGVFVVLAAGTWLLGAAVGAEAPELDADAAGQDPDGHLEATEFSGVPLMYAALALAMALGCNVLARHDARLLDAVRLRLLQLPVRANTLCAVLVGLTALIGGASIDALAALCIVGVSWHTVWPDVRRTGECLLQAAPARTEHILQRALHEVTTVPGVLEVVASHFWENAPGECIGSVSLRMREGSDEQAVLKRVRALFLGSVSELTVQVQGDGNWRY